MSFTNWQTPNQPDDAGLVEDYGHFYPGHVWNDLHLTYTLSFSMAIDKSAANTLSVSCYGGNDGQTYVTAGGGTAPYTYAWDNGQTTDTAYNLAAGDYIVTVTDASGCTAKDTATITEPNLITGLDSITACDTYTWIDGNTYTASNNTATHTLTAANGCDSVVTLDLTIIISPTVDLGNDISVCNGDSVTLQVDLGGGSYITNSLAIDLNIHDSNSYPGNGNAIYDISGNALHSTIVGGVNYTNNQIVLDGNNNYIQTPRIPGTGISSQSLSFELVVTPNSTSGNVLMMASLLTGSMGWNMPPIASANSKFYAKFLTSISNPNAFEYSYNVGQKYHLVLIWDHINNKQQFYVDGQLVAEESNTTYSSSGVNNYIFLGKENPGCCDTFDGVRSADFAGSYEVFRVYNKALTPTEISTNYNSISNGSISYNWDNGVANGVAFVPTATNTYTVTATDLNNCTATDDIIVTVNLLPTIVLGADTL